MLIFLPIISLVLLFLIIELDKNNWRYSLLSGLVIWGTLVIFITEFLSILQLITWEWVAFFWLLTNISLGLILFRLYKKDKKINLEITLDIPPSSIILLAGIATIVLVVGLVAIVAPPNHSDSMEYHMSRVVHWIQNHSIAHYKTHTPEQIYQNPWSEFAILHLQILSGGDTFANLIQWGSMVSSLVGVSLIAKQLGSNLRGQILASVFCVTIPMGILQSSSTNNDYVVAFWIVCFAYFTLLTVQEGIKLDNIFLLGSSLGLAILTKGTAYVYAFPFCIWLTIWGIKNLRWQIWKPILLVLLIALFLNLGHYTRNIIIFGSPFGLSTGETNKVFGVTIFISSLIKHLSLHSDIIRNLHLQNIVPSITGITEKLIKIIHGFLAVDINDPRLMNPKSPKFYVPAFSTYEDTAINPFHLGLILLGLVFFLLNKRLRNQPYLMSYLLAILGGFLIFSFLFTWSPWRCRLHLPLFVLASSFVGVTFSKSLNYQLNTIVAIFLLLLSYPLVVNNSVRPIVGNHNIFNTPRIDQYFVTQPYYKDYYQKAINTLKSENCFDIGLILEGTSFEYPLWVMLEKENKKFTLRHINVANESNIIKENLSLNNVKPCGIIAVSSKNMGKTFNYENMTYDEKWSGNWARGKFQVFTLHQTLK